MPNSNDDSRGRETRWLDARQRTRSSLTNYGEAEAQFRRDVPGTSAAASRDHGRAPFDAATSISPPTVSVSLRADSRCATTRRRRGGESRFPCSPPGCVDWQRADIRSAGIHLRSSGRRAFEEVRVSGPSLPSSRSGPAVKGGPAGPSEASREAAPLTAGERRLRSRNHLGFIRHGPPSAPDQRPTRLRPTPEFADPTANAASRLPCSRPPAARV
jgi:hypothetical protein